MKQRELFQVILDVYVTCGIRDFPIDCIDVIKKLKIPLFRYSELSAKKGKECYSVSDDAFKLKGKIYYNDAFPYICRQRFTLMHEVGHILLGHEGDTKENDDETNLFASHLLAPRILIHKYKCCDAIQIHDTFGLSYAASNRALMSYKKWFRDISCSASTKPTEPELQLEHIFFPELKLIPITEGIVGPAKVHHPEHEYEASDERSSFMDFLSTQRGDFGFAAAEDQWLYGNDL